MIVGMRRSVPAISSSAKISTSFGTRANFICSSMVAVLAYFLAMANVPAWTHNKTHSSLFFINSFDQKMPAKMGLVQFLYPTN
jgi:hypothetical protein